MSFIFVFIGRDVHYKNIHYSEVANLLYCCMQFSENLAAEHNQRVPIL